MNSVDRFMTAVAHKEPDCVPVAPYMGNFGARLAGIPIDKYCQDGTLMAEAQFEACSVLDQDVVVAQSDNYYLSEGFGMTVTHHPDSTPTFATPAFEDMSEVGKLRVPDPYTDGRMLVILEAVEILVSQLKGEKIIRVPGSGPFTLASHVMGTERFLIELATIDATNDKAAERQMVALLDLCTEALIAFQKACIDAGADIIQVGDSLASLNMISPTMFRKWAWPYQKKSFDFVNQYGREKGCVSLLHICGDNTQVVEDMANTGCDIIEVDTKVDMEFAKSRVGDRVALMGNLDPSSVLMQGSPDLVAEKSRVVIAKAAAGGGFILGSGCEVSPITPLENMKVMIKTARESVYPIQGSKAVDR